MARGSQFMSLVDDLRDELGLSTNVAVGIDDLPRLKRAINRSYAMIQSEGDWGALKYTAPRINLNSGQRYYDFPQTLTLEDTFEIRLFFNNIEYDISGDRGIGPREYATFDSVNGVRSDPVQKWDLQFSGSGKVPQIEVWPIPASNEQKLELRGLYKVAKLVNDNDICLLDDELVVLHAAYRLVARQKSDDAKLIAAELQKRMEQMKKRQGPARRFTIGGSDTANRDYRSTVSVTGR